MTHTDTERELESWLNARQQQIDLLTEKVDRFTQLPANAQELTLFAAFTRVRSFFNLAISNVQRIKKLDEELGGAHAAEIVATANKMEAQLLRARTFYENAGGKVLDAMYSLTPQVRRPPEL